MTHRSTLRAPSCPAIVLCTLIAGAGAAQPEALKPAADPDGVVRISMIAGSYFYKPNHNCTNKLLFLPSHRQQGMEGVLEVVE